MPTFTYPGVYIEELSSGVHSITGVATSIAAFIGWGPQGPIDEAVFIQSWADYEALFGGLDTRSLLGYSVNQFFANGGQQAYIVRLVWDGSLPASPGTSLTTASTAVAAGTGYATASITASLGAISAPAPVILSVGPAVLQSISIGPAGLPPIPLGATVKFAATGNFSDGNNSLLASAQWHSSNLAFLSPSITGVVTALGAGTALLTAKSGLITAAIPVTVTAAALTTIDVAPSTATLAAGQTQQLTATGNYSDGTARDLTSVVAWTQSSATATSITPDGLVTALNTPGAQTISATWAGVTDTAAITVTAKAVVAIRVHPNVSTLEPTQQVTFTAVGIFSDGTTGALPSPAVWSPSNAAVASIVSGTGVATAVAAGNETITATSGGLTASATLNVTAATLNSVSLTPVHPSIPKGATLQMNALGIYSDGTTADLTQSAAWSSGAPPNAAVDPKTGLVTGVAVNPAVTMTATWQGKTPTVSVAVVAPVLTSLALTPAKVTPLSGQTVQLTATGTFSDGTTQNLSSTAAWVSSSPTIASVSSLGKATALASGGSLTLFANNPGAWGNSLRISITPQASDPTHFGLLVQQVSPAGQLRTVESFVNLSVVPTDPLFAVNVIDSDSKFISFIDPASNAPVIPTAAPSPTATPIALSGGDDGSVLVPASDQNFEIALLQSLTSGLPLLDRVDIFNLLCVPAETDAPTIQKLQKYCADHRAFYIVDAPQLANTSNLIQSGPVGSTPGSISAANSANSAYYFPWVEAPDPLFGNRTTLYPPCGFVAGIYAATDANRGVWKAPAGIGAGLTGVSGLQYTLTDPENGALNIQAINCLRQFKVYGDVVWGARTLQGNDQAGSEWKYIPIRRLALFIESSLYDGTQWIVFEPNDVPLWSQIRLNVGAFMQGLFLQGAFQGTTPAQAYFVKCDAENNPQASIDLGIVNILVGFAPLYPAEFVVIQIQQIAGQVA